MCRTVQLGQHRRVGERLTQDGAHGFLHGQCHRVLHGLRDCFVETLRQAVEHGVESVDLGRQRLALPAVAVQLRIHGKLAPGLLSVQRRRRPAMPCAGTRTTAIAGHENAKLDRIVVQADVADLM
jgi:hypothetical protein